MKIEVERHISHIHTQKIHSKHIRTHARTTDLYDNDFDYVICITFLPVPLLYFECVFNFSQYAGLYSSKFIVVFNVVHFFG